MSPETVSSEFDIELADVHLALSYYYDNIGEIEDWRDHRSANPGERRRATVAEIRMNLIVDEDTKVSITDLLAQEGHDVVRVQDAELGIGDDDVIEY